jgi:hypothetical protein
MNSSEQNPDRQASSTTESRSTRWRRANVERARANDANTYARHGEAMRKRHNERSIRARLEALSAYSNGSMKCACCGEAEVAFLTLDHADNNGRAQRRETKVSGTSWFYYLRKLGYPKEFNLRVLCFNCNCGRRTAGQNGRCPHEDGR